MNIQVSQQAEQIAVKLQAMATREQGETERETWLRNLNARDLVYKLSGDHNKDLRQQIMKALTSEDIPKAKSGVNAIMKVLYIN